MGRPILDAPGSAEVGRRRGAPDAPDTDGVLVLIGGRSGCGKTALVDALIAAHPQTYARVPSFTSRARRPGEGDAEYEFVPREAIAAMHRRGELLSLDEAYGEHYGMSRRAIDTILAGGRIAVKEMHARNHAAVRAARPSTISVLLQLDDARWDTERAALEPSRARRLADDSDYYAKVPTDGFEVVHRIDLGETPAMAAAAVHAKLQPLIAGRRQDVPE